MRLLVLGAGGKVGQLLRAAWPENADVIPTWQGGPRTAVQFDILQDLSALQNAMDAADTVLLLAGVTHARSDRPLSNNSSLAATVLDRAVDKRVFLTSSAAVYGRGKGVFREDAPLAPTSAYGRSKAAMEALATNHSNACVLRIGNIAGADALLGVPRDSYLLDQFPGGGFPVRSYIGPALLARTLIKLVLRPAADLPPVLNIACPEPVSMADLLDAAGKEWMPRPAGDEAIERVVLDTRALWGAAKPPSDARAIVADWAQTVTLQ